ncbi:helix-turn-helix domain-containing protein [Moorella naiadis]|uniref:helix-turn-helix domain-containing protein n=1 Tax=Moorella naiadis (nom. illeg.) TaxID=3093670 RepID=UPI003D9C7D80
MEILTAKEAAKMLKISEYTPLRKYAKKGKIPAHKIGNQWCFSKEELLDWFHAANLDVLAEEAEKEYRSEQTIRLWSER